MPSWLGIDVGSGKSKALTFCLVEAADDGAFTVHFERGNIRPLAGDPGWPKAAADYLDLSRTTLLSSDAETLVRSTLSRSALVARWVMRPTGVAIDAPCGFAVAGQKRRNTEQHAASSYATPSFDVFLAAMKGYLATNKSAPLYNFHIWKLIGLAAFRHLLDLTSKLPFGEPVEKIAPVCSGAGAPGGTSVREAFPSETYARAGRLDPKARQLLATLADAPWAFDGNSHGGQSSVPTRYMQDRLLGHRTTLLTELHSGSALGSMLKIAKDPSWADLWDAFACAYVSVCDSFGAAVLIGTDSARLAGEGAIVAPVAY